MTVSQGVINTFGALGGALLAACLVPQLVRIYTTRSARDLSYVFLFTFTIGLILMIVYLIFEQATVGWALGVVELAILIAMILAKVYFDNWGPLANKTSPYGSLSIATKARMELHRFFAGKGGSAFPLLLEPTGEHNAAHLLLDCLLPANKNDASNTKSKRKGVDVEAADVDTMPSSAFVFNDFVDLLEVCLEDARVDVIKRYTRSFPSFRRHQSATTPSNTKAVNGGSMLQSNSTHEDRATLAALHHIDISTPPNMSFIACNDGYVTAMWFVASSTLAVDFVGASPEVIRCMNCAAEGFCKSLDEKYPGTKIAASSMARLPSREF